MAKKTFGDLARREGAVAVHDFRQIQFLKDATGKPEPEGKCFAFILAYLTCLRTGLIGQHLFETLEIAIKTNDKAVIKEILGSPGKISSDPNWMGTDLFNLQHSRHLGEYYSGIGLEKDKERRFDDRFFRNKAVGTYIVNTDPLYSIIKSRVHIMAATSHAYADRSVFTFFDPNFGEAVFKSGDCLTSFVATFFSKKVINKGYRPTVKDLKDVPLMSEKEKKLLKEESMSLILTVQGFKEITPIGPPERDQYGELVKKRN
jgi:hypothetical protein